MPPISSRSQALMEKRIAQGLKQRREHLELSVADLAARSNVSRAMIFKIEAQQASPTAALLGKLCNGLGMTLSSLILNAERSTASPVTRAAEQPTWRDPDTGLLRAIVSPANSTSRVEIVRIDLPAGQQVKYEEQRHTYYEQQIVVLQGKLTVTIGQEQVELGADDCMHMQMNAPHVFANRGRGTCRYLVVVNR